MRLVKVGNRSSASRNSNAHTYKSSIAKPNSTQLTASLNKSRNSGAKALTGVAIIGGLLASVLVAIVATSSPVSSSQRTALTIMNAHTLEADEKLGNPANQARVTVRPVSDCEPGEGGSPLKDEFILDAGESQIIGLLSTNCNWEIQVVNVGSKSRIVADAVAVVCATELTPLGTDGMGVDTNGDNMVDTYSPGSNPTSATGHTTLFLNGVGGRNSLQLGGVSIPSISLNFLETDSSCTASLQPEVSIAVPQTESNGVNVWAGMEFDVDYTSDIEGCDELYTTRYRINNSGAVELAADEQAPILHYQNIYHFYAVSNPPPGFDESMNSCRYRVEFPPYIGSLALSSLTQTRGPDDNSENIVPADSIYAGHEANPLAISLNATYAEAQVAVHVRAAFPSDALFSTEDKVAYSIEVLSPCGGVLAIVPDIVSKPAEYASAQAFPGSFTVFGSIQNEVLEESRTFATDAFADPNGDVPCSVRVTESSTPAGCVATGGNVQTQTYSPGLGAMRFEFAHSCESGAGGTTPPAVPDTDDGSGPPREEPTG